MQLLIYSIYKSHNIKILCIHIYIYLNFFKQDYISLLNIGSGKTHYIKKCLTCNFYEKSKTICINESFNKTEVVQQLREYSLTTCNLTIFLKISLLWPQVSNIL